MLNKLNDILIDREKRGLLRTLNNNINNNNELIDFSSNDYLGFNMNNDNQLNELINNEYNKVKLNINGSTGSRLLTGNNEYFDELEKYIANYHEQESALLFNSGYDCNLGIFSSIPQKNDYILFDELIHNSVREGLRLSRGKSISFKHNDINDLIKQINLINNNNNNKKDNNKKQKLDNNNNNNNNKPNIIIAIESVYSMDGDISPLLEIVDICKNYNNVSIIVDEAHSTGIIGNNGKGLVCDLKLNKNKYILCVVHTYGKAMGVHGAAVVGSKIIRNYLINYARSFVFTTSLPLHSLVSIKCSYEYMKVVSNSRQKLLKDRIDHFQSRLREEFREEQYLISHTSIQAIIIPDNFEVIRVSKHLRENNNMMVLPIRSPTVKIARIRIILHYHNTIDEINKLIDCLKAQICN